MRKGQKWWLTDVNRETRNVGDQVIGKGYFFFPYIFVDHCNRALFHFKKNQDLTPIALCSEVRRTFKDHTDNTENFPCP